MTWGGALFLFVYGGLSLRRALGPAESLTAATTGNGTLAHALLTCLALTWLNPHVYLDTLALLGAISSPYQGVDRWAFGVGAVCASFCFFFSLGYGAKYLTPIFASPAAWRVLDVLIGIVMWAIAAALLL